MFKFGKKEKSKSDEKKKERRDSKKEKKVKDHITVGQDDGERYTPITFPPPVAPKPSKSQQSSVANVNVKSNSSTPTTKPKSILKFRSSGKSKSHDRPSNINDSSTLEENTRINEDMIWREPATDVKSGGHDRRKRESIHSITMNISPPSVPPPPSPTEKVYAVNLELPIIHVPKPADVRHLNIFRQPTGDFGFNLRWAPYTDGVASPSRSVVFAEPGSSGSKSGVIAGDRIIEINDTNVESSSKEEVIHLIQQSQEPLRLKVQQIPEVSELSKRTTGSLSNGHTNIYQQENLNIQYVNGDGNERMWLIHRGGYSLCTIIPSPNSLEGRCKVKVEQGGDLLEVDENDLEKVNPEKLARCEQLSSLAYLNESSILHVLRQRYGSSLTHTFAGSNLIVISARHPLNIYSQKVMQMIHSCKPRDLPPHVFSKAQSVYKELLSSSRDQTIVLTGRTGSGKTTTLRHILSFYALMYGGVHSVSLDEKLSASNFILECFGNCSTSLNRNASRFTQLITLDFDNYGRLTSAYFQVSMLEKSRVIRQSDGELPFHVFNYMINGADPDTKQELLLQHMTPSNQFFELTQNVDRETAVSGWSKLDLAMRLLAITPEESKIVYQIIAAIIHLGKVGVFKGANNKVYFSEPGSAQNAAKLLGVTMEDLSRSIFNPSSLSSSKTNLRVADDDEVVSGLEALEGFVIGLYSDVVSLLISLINRSVSSVARNPSSITIVDIPGMRVDTNPGTFDDLCYNYVNERLQLLFHDKTFVESQERYTQENIDVDLDNVETTPETMVRMLDKCTNQQLLQSSGSSRVDLSFLGVDNESDPGILWILDECSITPGATEQNFIEKVVKTHTKSSNHGERLLTYDPSRPSMLTINHCQATSRVTYCTNGWIKACRDNPNTKQASLLLANSQRSEVADVFNSIRGSMTSSFGASPTRDGTLRRGASMRRAIVNQAGIKRRSLAILLKFQADSLVDTVSKTGLHFISHIVPDKKISTDSNSSRDMVIDVPCLRSQVRALEILPAIRFYRQGFPEHMQFSEFLSRYSILSGQDSQLNIPLVDQKLAVEELLSLVDIDKSRYRVGLSQVFFRTVALDEIDYQRELRRSFYAVIIQKHVRRYLAQKAISRLKLKHEAMKCLQKNIRIYFTLRDWPWWKVYTKIKPLLNVQKTEDDLKNCEKELAELKARFTKVENEKNSYKRDCARLEDEVSISSKSLILV